MNETIRKFGHPATLVHDYEHWVVLLRPKQPTLASFVLACKDEAKALPDISGAAFTELKRVTQALEATLRALFRHDKINYIMLMMVDPDVHFHVIPRYASQRDFGGVRFADPGWPKLPELSHEHSVPEEVFESLRRTLADAWSVS
jgi:diadenosine tetraphosphate (Ap4A) HIT family hydrolase